MPVMGIRRSTFPFSGPVRVDKVIATTPCHRARSQDWCHKFAHRASGQVGTDLAASRPARTRPSASGGCQGPDFHNDERHEPIRRQGWDLVLVTNTSAMCNSSSRATLAVTNGRRRLFPKTWRVQRAKCTLTAAHRLQEGVKTPRGHAPFWEYLWRDKSGSRATKAPSGPSESGCTTSGFQWAC